MFQTETVIYIYMGVCLCMLGFNCLLVLYRRIETILFYRYVNQYCRLLDRQCDYMRENGHIEQNILTKLGRQLRNAKRLQAFHGAVIEKLEEDEKYVKAFFDECEPLFLGLVKTYTKRDNIQKAYFAYLMSVYRINMPRQRNEIVDMMRQLISHSSAYCRENALKALYSFGDEGNLYYALKTLSDSGIFHHSKLIMDGLMNFQGDKIYLAEMLWKGLEDFKMDFQVSIINYIGQVSEHYKEEFYDKLNTTQRLDKEVRIALIRYFRKYKCARVINVLIHMYENMGDTEWEVRAVIVTVLREYEGRNTMEILTKALYHQNWYIRHNAAESIEYRNIAFQDLADVYNGRNRFAREIIAYQRQKKQIHERSMHVESDGWITCDEQEESFI